MKNINFLHVSISILLGFFLGAGLTHFHLITVEKTISVGNILKSITTILVAVFVTGYLRNFFDQNRKEKEIIFGLFEQLNGPISNIEKWGSSESLDLVNSELHQLAKDAEFIRKLLSDSGYSETIVTKCDFTGKIQDICQLATYIPPRTTDSTDDAEPPLSVKDSVYTWGPLRQQEIEVAAATLKRANFYAQIMFNRC